MKDPIMKSPFIGALQCLALAVLFSTLSSQGAEEEQPKSLLEGTWHWTFTMPDASKVSPTVHFKLESNKWKGTSRFRPGSSTPVTKLTLNGNELKFEVVRERDGQKTTTRYAGKIDGDMIRGKVTSNWNGQETSYDWEARRLIDVEGTWKWTSSFGRGGSDRPGFENTLTLKRDKEKVTGKLKAGRFGDSDISHGRFRKNELSFELVRERDGEKSTNFYRGKLAGDTIEGKSILTFGETTRTNEWKATRAD